MIKNVTFKFHNYALINRDDSRKGIAFKFSDQINILTGPNSSGKTIILQSIATMLGSTDMRSLLDNSLRNGGDNIKFILEFEFNEIFFVVSYQYNKVNKKGLYKIKDCSTGVVTQGETSTIIREIFRQKFDFPFYVTWDQSGREVEMNEFISLIYNYPAKRKDMYMYSGSMPNNSHYTRYIVSIFWATFNNVFINFLKTSNEFERLDIKINEAASLDKHIQQIKDAANIVSNAKKSDDAVQNTLAKISEYESERRSIIFEIHELEGLIKNRIRSFVDSKEGQELFNYLSQTNNPEIIEKIKSEMNAYAVSKHENFSLAKEEIQTLKISLKEVESKIEEIKKLTKVDIESSVLEKAYEVLVSKLEDKQKDNKEEMLKIEKFKAQWRIYYEMIKNSFSMTQPEIEKILGEKISWNTNSIELNPGDYGDAEQLALRIAAQINLLETLSRANYQVLNFVNSKEISNGKTNVHFPHIIDGAFAEDLSTTSLKLSDDVVQKISKLLCSYSNQIIFSVANANYRKAVVDCAEISKRNEIKIIETYGQRIKISSQIMSENSMIIANELLNKMESTNFEDIIL